MRKLIFTLLLAAATSAVMAIPAKRVTRVVNINGRSVTLTLMGDENLHYWQAADGSTYRMTDEMTVVPFDVATAQAVSVRRKTAQMQEAEATDGNDMQRISAMNRVKYSGERHGLVILVNFSDLSFAIDNPQETFKKVCSERDFKGLNQYGSVRDYFYSQSYGEFDFNLDVVGPVTLPHEMAYYGGNTSSGSDQNPAEMAYDACKLVDEDVDFTVYDWDGDKVVENIFIVYAGYGEAQGGPAESVWPHAWVIEATGKTLRLDGVRISSYACGSELNGNSGKTVTGIGTICHEFSHCFGLPDFYCTDYNHNELTMNTWSVMDMGSYNGGGFCPAAYTAYERWFCGWLEPKVLDEPTEVDALVDINKEGDSYILYNQGNKNEYYIMYNVQQSGWNTNMPGHGMLVVHVDYNKSIWDQNKPNNDAKHLRMTPICADNNRSLQSMAGDPYPGTSRNKALTDESRPAAELFNTNKDGRKFMGHPIEDIKEVSKKISFIFDGGIAAAVPENFTVTESGKENFTVKWDAAENAVSYMVEYGIYTQGLTAGEPLVNETFEPASANSSVDIGTSLDEHTTMPGFTGSKLYEGTKGLLFGTASVKGYMITPELNFAGDEETVTFEAANFNALTTKVTVSALDAEGNELNKSEVSLSGTAVSEYAVVVNVKGAVRLKITGSFRFYMASLKVGGAVPNPYSDAVTLEGIQDTQLTITPEKVADAYYVKVCSVNKKGKASDWTDILHVNADNTAIVNVNANSANTVVYSIDGRRMHGTLGQGLYIVNGKKYVVK